MASKNIFIAFLLNLVFVVIEVVGGILTNSIAILSDSIHDAGDCFAICVAFLLEKKSNKKADKKYSYGYKRFSVLSALITSCILLVGSGLVVYNSILRIMNPSSINGLGMFIIAIFGVLINGIAVIKTSKSKNLNEKSINLHMLEDVLGWLVVLIGSIFVWLFDFVILDPILSICVSVYVVIHAFVHIVEAFFIILEKSPKDFNVNQFEFDIEQINNVKSVHHIHIWTMDGESLLATMHVVVRDFDKDKICETKEHIKTLCSGYNIKHVTIQVDYEHEKCIECEMNNTKEEHHHDHLHCHSHKH